MKNELILKKCKSCGTVVKVLTSSKLENCENDMEDVIANSVDCAVEKHIPTYEIDDDELVVRVNHVMEKDHFIEWISLVKENKEITVKLYPEQEAIVRFPYIKGATLYAYCNKHGLWKKDIED